MSPHSSRKDFPLAEGLTFLSHGAFGVTPRAIMKERQRLLEQQEENPVHFYTYELKPLIEDTLACLGASLHADKDTFTPLENVTVGINIILQSDFLQPGDELLVSDHEYSGFHPLYEFLQKSKGIQVSTFTLKFQGNTAASIQQTLSTLISPRTRVVLLSHVSYKSGEIFPITEICDYLRSKGIRSIIDGSQAVGHIHVDIQDLKPDTYIGSLHKWFLCPRPSAFMYVRPELQQYIHPLYYSFRSKSVIATDNPFLDDFTWVGTRDFTPVLSTPYAATYRSTNSWDVLMREARALAQKGYQLLCARLNCAERHTNFAQLFSVPLAEGIDLVELYRDLVKNESIEVKFDWFHESPFLRASAHCYNSLEDYEKLAHALTSRSITGR